MDYSWLMQQQQPQDTSPGIGLGTQVTVEHHQCNLVGGSGLFVQIALGLMSFTVLVYKKQIETPPRPFKIWLLDSSKQVLSALFAHLANMVFSILMTQTGHAGENAPPPSLLSQPTPYIFGLYSNEYTINYYNYSSVSTQSYSAQDQLQFTTSPSSSIGRIFLQGLAFLQTQSDPCNYYFITVVIDTSCGVFLSCFFLATLDGFFKRKGWEQLRTGNYYKESKIHKQWKLVDEQQNEMNVPIEDTNYIEIDYLAWLIQLAIWLSITFVTKMILFEMQALLKEPLGVFSFYILIWLNPFPIAKLIFVMIFVPTIMNGIQFWIQDNVLKKKSYAADSEEIEEAEEEAHVRRHLEFDELYPNEEQYSAQISQAQLSQFMIPPTVDPHMNLHNVSFSKNYKDNDKKNQISRGASCTELKGNSTPEYTIQIQHNHCESTVSQNNNQLSKSPNFCNDSNDIGYQVEAELDSNSQMNKGFATSHLADLTEHSGTNFHNFNLIAKTSKFSQFKELAPNAELLSNQSRLGANLDLISSNGQTAQISSSKLPSENSK